MIEIIPTNTCPPDFSELARRSEAFAAFAPHVQLDIDDGLFAPAISWPYHEGQWAELEQMAESRQMLPHSDKMKYEAHMMVEEPLRIGELLARSGCERIIAHVESFVDRESGTSAFSAWKSAGASEVGLAILIDTPLSTLAPFIGECDAVQMMSIATLGAQGASFDTRVFARIEELHALHPGLVIAVDGGVSESNIAALTSAGARRFGVGSAISKSADPAGAYERLKTLAESAIL